MYTGFAVACQTRHQAQQSLAYGFRYHFDNLRFTHSQNGNRFMCGLYFQTMIHTFKNIHVRALLSFQQPTCQKFATSNNQIQMPRVFETCSYDCCFK